MYVWPYSTRSARAIKGVDAPAGLRSPDEFSSNDAEVRLWITQRHWEGIDWLSQHHDVSQPDVLRALIFRHLYGTVALAALCQHVAAAKIEKDRPRVDLTNRSVFDYADRHAGDIERSTARTQTDIEHIGQAGDNNFKLQLPTRMLEDLKSVAAAHGISASAFGRKLLVQEIEGERAHTPWQVAVKRLS